MKAGTYNVTLINLAPDARSAAPGGQKLEQRGIAGEEIRILLQNFCDIDPVENAMAEPEIRVQARGQSCRIQAGHKKLIFYDALNRDAPGHMCSVAEVMAELDGSASAARSTPLLAQALASGSMRAAAGYVPPPPSAPNVARLTGMSLGAAALLGALVYLHLSRPADEPRSGFQPLPAAEAEALRTSIAGVYLTGAEPGRHGIVVQPTGELRLFQLRATEAPRLVHATAEPGRTGASLAFATNQPGGHVEIRDAETLVYCGETYKRVR